ncbi:MAG TPA: prolyl oligopeptidase family serine peptidase [Mycobacteriales bacterium]|nr:prolyl oligopeptidase family serine peptidase [Mycobacteriales bacterium]
MTEPADDFPRRYARTQRFSLGAPRSFIVSGDGRRVVFCRTAGGADATSGLWLLEVDTGVERLIADPALLLADAGPAEVPAEERARRERSRETGSGIVAAAADTAAGCVAFTLGGRLFSADLETGAVDEIATPGPVIDPRPDPTGRRIGYVTGGELHVVERSGGDRRVAADDRPEVSWGLAEFIAAEEMDRHRGFWWSPDGQRLLVARVDVSAVAVRYLADPANPDRPPVPWRYPAAGTANAEVSLHVVDLAGRRVPVHLPPDHPYLVNVCWDAAGPPLAVVQTRDQRRVTVLEIDPETGLGTVLRVDEDPAWVGLVTGVPARLPDGRLVWAADADGWRRLLVDGTPVSPVGLQLRRVVGVAGSAVWFTGSTEPTEVDVWCWRDGALTRVSEAAGVHDAAVGGDVAVLTSAAAGTDRVRSVVRGGHQPTREVASFAEPYPWPDTTRLLTIGPRELRVAVLLPRDHLPGRKLPVLLDPYGGPGAQRVLAAPGAWLASQWLADQGFGVVVADGRGTPGRGNEWERAIHGDLATVVLEDQVEALRGALLAVPDLDGSRVGIRGWSFGGYLAALAVLRRPDVFHAAVAGAPVTDWLLYDTHYTERYLGHPDHAPENYRNSSLLDSAAQLTAPLMIIHGLVDDNVLVAHSLRLSQRLLEAGRPHTVLPLSGITHMAADEIVAENLLRLQVRFLHQVLGTVAGG